MPEDLAPQGQKEIREGRGEVVLPTEIKPFMQCKARLLPSLGSARSMSRSALCLTNKLLAVLFCTKFCLLTEFIPSRRWRAEVQCHFLVTLPPSLPLVWPISGNKHGHLMVPVDLRGWEPHCLQSVLQRGQRESCDKSLKWRLDNRGSTKQSYRKTQISGGDLHLERYSL